MSLFSAVRRLQAPEDSGAVPEMVDLAFALDGETLPHGYRFPLERALMAALPWLAEEPLAGVHPVRAPSTAYGYMLSRRARLVLRLPEARVEAGRALEGLRLSVGDAELVVGSAMVRPVTAFPTLRAGLVATSTPDETGFMEEVDRRLEALGVAAYMICGKPHRLGEAARQVAGYSLVLHELSPRHSLLLQAFGLGPERRLGCGLFIHHKVIEGLGDSPD